MSSTRELLVPDIGDFKDVPIIEVFIKAGETIAKDAPVVTMESEKSTLDVPSDLAGIIAEVKVKPGDRVSRGSVLAIIQVAAAPDAPASAAGQESVSDLLVPDIGDFKDVPVIEIFIKVGEELAKDAPVVTLESEKSTLDVPASLAGTVKEVLLKPGDRVSAGALIARIATKQAAQTAPTTVPQPAGYGSAGDAPGKPAAAPAAQSAPQPAAVAANEAIAPTGGFVHASPSIRRFARELGVTLSAVRGSGPNGRITREDVQNWVKKALSTGAASNGGGADSGMNILPWPKVDFAAFGSIERVPLSRIKKLSGPNLHRNWVMIPHVTHNDEADITELEALRKQINAEQSDAKVTMLAFLIVASIAALKRFPDFNSSLEGDELVRKHYYNIGFAADTPNGLMVPVIRDADKKGVLAIARETSELAKKARDGKLSSSEMQGGTFTISSLGGIGGVSFTPIINAPEVAILGVTKAAMKPVWDGKAFQPRLMVPLSLSYDHRVVDGAAAARFCVMLVQTLVDLRRALL
jgi:pyruvate dehydrogenase E2 component (dihydrolipoamide acetyltransferase)